MDLLQIYCLQFTCTPIIVKLIIIIITGKHDSSKNDVISKKRSYY